MYVGGLLSGVIYMSVCMYVCPFLDLKGEGEGGRGRAERSGIEGSTGCVRACVRAL